MPDAHNVIREVCKSRWCRVSVDGPQLRNREQTKSSCRTPRLLRTPRPARSTHDQLSRHPPPPDVHLENPRPRPTEEGNGGKRARLCEIAGVLP